MSNSSTYLTTRKCNPNNNAISPHANQHGNHQEINQQVNKYQNKLVRMWKREFSFTVCENLNEGRHNEIHQGYSAKIGPPYDPDRTRVGTYIKSVYDSTFHNSQIMESALICINGCMDKKMWSVYAVGFYSAIIKKNTICSERHAIDDYHVR
jgi:hypothetical protein